MKNSKFFYYFLVVSMVSLVACEKGRDSDQKDSQILTGTKVGQSENTGTFSNVSKQDLSGKWMNTQLNTDTLFWNDSILMGTDTITSLPKHSYRYELFDDSIKLKYNGEYYILVLESSFKLMMNDDKSMITIEGIENYFPGYKGNQFRKITTNN